MKLTYKFQEKDARDYIFKTENLKATINAKVTTTVPVLLPVSFMVPVLPAIINQDVLGDCVANAFYYSLMSQTNNSVPLSRLFVYANCRCLDNTPLDQDDGTTIRTACRAILNYGVCKESVYPHIVNKFMNLPPLEAYYASKKFKRFTYVFINQDLASIKSALTTFKVPIIFGIMVYEGFMNTKTGFIPMPSKELLGGHCVCLVGYNDINQTFVCANSWGTNWGNKGYFYLPYNYVINPKYASDFCVTAFVY
jgi:C1A family cysteine protease